MKVPSQEDDRVSSEVNSIRVKVDEWTKARIVIRQCWVRGVRSGPSQSSPVLVVNAPRSRVERMGEVQCNQSMLLHLKVSPRTQLQRRCRDRRQVHAVHIDFAVDKPAKAGNQSVLGRKVALGAADRCSTDAQTRTVKIDWAFFPLRHLLEEKGEARLCRRVLLYKVDDGAAQSEGEMNVILGS